MESPDKKLQELLNYPERECPDPGLADDAAWITYEFYGRKKRRGKKIWPKLVSVCAVCAAAIVLAIVLPIYCRPAPPPAVDEPHRYLEDELVRQELSNIDEFLGKNKISILYFTGQNTKSFVYRVIETSKTVMITQQHLHVGSNGFETVELQVCLTNDEFARHEIYDDLDNSQVIEGITVQYTLQNDNSKNTFLINFEYENHEYYMSISSTKGQSDLEYYMQLLLGKN